MEPTIDSENSKAIFFPEGVKCVMAERRSGKRRQGEHIMGLLKFVIPKKRLVLCPEIVSY